MREKKLIFISSRQIELQAERSRLRDFINFDDNVLPMLFVAKTFEADMAGRKESVCHVTEEWLLKSDIYLGILGNEYSEATIREYEIAIKDKQVRKEFIIIVKQSDTHSRSKEWSDFLEKIRDPASGHACVFYNSLEELKKNTKQALLEYYCRQTEGFILSKEFLGPNLERAKNTNMPEKTRRKFLQPSGRFSIWRGRKGIPEYYIYDWDGTKIDMTWDSIEPSAPEYVKEFYKKRYRKPFDDAKTSQISGALDTKTDF
jgi:hypothetical protein